MKSTKHTENKLDFIKIENTCSSKDNTVTKMKRQATNWGGGEYTQIIYLRKDLFLEHTKTSFNLIIRQRTQGGNNGKMILTDIQIFHQMRDRRRK